MEKNWRLIQFRDCKNCPTLRSWLHSLRQKPRVGRGGRLQEKTLFCLIVRFISSINKRLQPSSRFLGGKYPLRVPRDLRFDGRSLVHFSTGLYLVSSFRSSHSLLRDSVEACWDSRGQEERWSMSEGMTQPFIQYTYMWDSILGSKSEAGRSKESKAPSSQRSSCPNELYTSVWCREVDNK